MQKVQIGAKSANCPQVFRAAVLIVYLFAIRNIQGLAHSRANARSSS